MVLGLDGKLLPHLRMNEKGWGRTEEDDGKPIESRLKEMMPSEGKRSWKGRVERRLREGEVKRREERRR